jgi:DNA topoisomerase-1
MADALVEKTTISVNMDNSPVIFNATGEVIKFDGFLKVYTESSDIENQDEEKGLLPPLKTEMPLYYNNVSAVQKFTMQFQDIPRQVLLKSWIELGIGRPQLMLPQFPQSRNRGYVLKRRQTRR